MYMSQQFHMGCICHSSPQYMNIYTHIYVNIYIYIYIYICMYVQIYMYTYVIFIKHTRQATHA
jgi:hypothetical protein